MTTTDSPPTACKPGHIGINVLDLDRSTDFYCQVFGLELAERHNEDGRSWAFLVADGQLLVTLWQQADQPFVTTAAGLHHLSFEVDTMDQVRQAEARLRRLGAEFAYDGVVPHSEGADSGGIFFTDPDGTRLEIYALTGAANHAAPNGEAPACGFF